MFTGAGKNLFMNQIYDYSDYRQFIKDYYETNKVKNSAFSYRYLAQKAGINSSPFFKFIIEGTRNLTKQTIIKTCIALKLDDKEAEYFENLVFFNQAKTLKEKNYFFDKLIGLQKLQKIKKITVDQYDYFNEWYHCIIRELVIIADIRNEKETTKIARLLKPSITAAQVNKSLRLLLELGFLKKENGRFVQTEPVLTTGPNIKNFQVIQFQIQMLKNAIEAFNLCKSEERLASSTTLGISEETYKNFVHKIRDFRNHLMEIARNDDNPEIVYQLNVNLFPLSAKVTRGGKNG